MSRETIEARYRELTPTSRQMFEDGRSVNAGAAKGAYYFAPYPITLRRGKGCVLEDVDGRSYVDFSNHHTAQVLGHNHPAILEAVKRQLADGIALGAAMGVETRLARMMCKRVSSVERIRFVNSGTEATLHAIRLARCFSGRPKVAKFEGGYHGSHDAVEISTAPPLESAGEAAEPNAVPSTGGMALRALEDTIVLPYNDEESVERLLLRHRDELACVILDPKAGIIPIRHDFIQRVRAITEELGILIILDEVVGFRQVKGGLQSHVGVRPDLTCFGKMIGGGFPIGAFGGRADIMDLLDNSGGSSPVFQSGTHSSHAVAMATGIATLESLTDEAYAHLNRLGNRLKTGLDGLFADRGVVAQVVVTGSVFSIHFGIDRLHNYRDLAQSDKAMVHAVFLSLLNQGYFSGNGLNMCAISLPTRDNHIDGLISAVGNALDEATSPAVSGLENLRARRKEIAGRKRRLVVHSDGMHMGKDGGVLETYECIFPYLTGMPVDTLTYSLVHQFNVARLYRSQVAQEWPRGHIAEVYGDGPDGRSTSIFAARMASRRSGPCA